MRRGSLPHIVSWTPAPEGTLTSRTARPILQHRRGFLPRDPILRAGAAIWLLSLVPSLAGVGPTSPWSTWADQYSDVPTLGFVLVAAALRLKIASERKERRFWLLFIASMSSWAAVRALYLFVPLGERGVKSDLFSDACYLFGYLCLGLALELRPDRDPPGLNAMKRVEFLGTLIFAFFLLAYLAVATSVFNPEVYATWVTSMFIFAVLDAYLLLRVTRLLQGELAPEWVVPMRSLRAVFALWLFGDVLEGAMYAGAIPFLEPATPADLVWAVPMLLLLVAVRSRGWSQGGEPAPLSPT